MLKATDIQGQAKALKELCTKLNKCKFEPSERRQTYTPSQVFGSTVTNCDWVLLGPLCLAFYLGVKRKGAAG